ncbi:MAG: CBS domain-containing protein [Methanobacteriota archaeon]|nr:MAG: CBS domain-containing protein [Euryarchaeota archaeon]
MVDDKPISDIRVSDVIAEVGKTTKAATVRKDATLREAVEAMVEDSETRKVYVLDDQNKLVGTITLETLLRHAGYRLGVRKVGMTSFLRMLAEISDDKVTDVMNKPISVLHNEMIVNVTRLMVENHLNDLPIVDAENKVMGELNGLDILKSSMKHWN